MERKSEILDELYEVLKDRKEKRPEGSYTVKLFDGGIDRILKKVGEEAGETIIAGKNADPEEIGWEIADLIYHMWVMLAYYGISPDVVFDKLIERR